ncbi:hypothetical protein B4092_0946 [Bacillus licheniformis]|nr:hypothetical protein B4092_0946 [Bacillus licheniformis]
MFPHLPIFFECFNNSVLKNLMYIQYILIISLECSKTKL